MPPYCCNSVATEISSFPFLCARKISRALLECALIKHCHERDIYVSNKHKNCLFKKCHETTGLDRLFQIFIFHSVSVGAGFLDLKFRVTGS